jgi:DNA-binding response OmpR family regulator
VSPAVRITPDATSDAPVTILLVEDEPAIRQLMAMSLEHAGYRVIQAKNGSEALTLFGPTVDLLLTDLRMPYVSGETLVSELRARRHSLKILAFSAASTDMLDPDVPFLSKPFSRDDLLKAVRAALER